MPNITELEAKYQELGKEIEKLKVTECEYPKFFRHKDCNYIVKFTSLREGVLMPALENSGSDNKSCWTSHTNTEVWEEVPYDKETGFYYKQLVWCWSKYDTHERKLRFYDAINKRVFTFWGKQKGSTFDNYKAYDWSCDSINKWAIEAIKTLKDK